MSNLIRCVHCNYVLVDSFFPTDMRGYYDDMCSSGLCLQFCCARCHGVWSTNGPTNCPSCSGVSRWGTFCIWFDGWTDKLWRKIKRLTR